MKPVRVVRGAMVPLDRADVDTDQIIPQQFLKRIERDGYGEFIFYNWAHDDDGSPIEDFITNRPERREARILVAGRNFGCGSSREHAPWALQDWGFDAVIAPSTADIFRNNSANIGLLVVELPDADVRRLMEMAQDPTATITIDLEQQTVVGDGLETTFEFDPSAKERLLEGLDWIGMTLTHEDAITRHELDRPSWLPVSTGSQTA
ncbi:MAG: 3-isopropylmalate dehydratase small subunit [Acidimicrobiia bacterium]